MEATTAVVWLPKRLNIFFGFAVLFLIISTSSHLVGAPLNWTLTLDNTEQSGPPGSTLVFSGTIMNATGGDLFLDTAAIVFVTAASSDTYVKDYADEFLSTLGIIPDSGYTGPLFFIQWLPSAPAGATGVGAFELAAFPPADPTVLAAEFSASISVSSPVPEPGSAILVIIGGALLAAGLRRRPAID